MKRFAVVLSLAAAAWLAHAQSGGPSPAGQSVSPLAASAAERGVERRHEKALARSRARGDRHASALAGAASAPGPSSAASAKRRWHAPKLRPGATPAINPEASPDKKGGN
jgi:hypothetical protein